MELTELVNIQGQSFLLKQTYCSSIRARDNFSVGDKVTLQAPANQIVVLSKLIGNSSYRTEMDVVVDNVTIHASRNLVPPELANNDTNAFFISNSGAGTVNRSGLARACPALWGSTITIEAIELEQSTSKYYYNYQFYEIVKDL